MRVSVRELKNQLSHYLHLAEHGETIIITSRNAPLARLLPIPKAERLGLAEAEGVVWNGRKPQGGRLRPVIEGKSAAERVLEDRR